MSNPFLGQIKMYAYDWAPRGWALCNGQLLSIAQNTALFSLLGTTYGGNGQTTFALPDLRGRTPVNFGGAYALGQVSGQETVTLLASNMPAHSHVLSGTTATATRRLPPGRLLATDSASKADYYATPTSNLTSLAPASVSNVGGNQPHTNMQPYAVTSFCIALQGIFPSRN